MNGPEKRPHPYLCVAVFVAGAVLGYAFGASKPHEAPEAPAAMEHADHGHAPHAAHAMLEVPPGAPVPTVAIEATPDAKDGYNLRFILKDFTLTPEETGGAPVPNAGHMHLYVNGEKVARVYGEWFHLPAAALKDGENAIEVTLNANDHGEWTAGGQHVGAAATITK